MLLFLDHSYTIQKYNLFRHPMQRLGSPSRSKRLHTISQNHLIPSNSAVFRINRPRLNTLQDQPKISDRKNSLSAQKQKIMLAPLSPPKYYQTKLALSSEAWAVYNMNQHRYKRGWKPNRILQFNGLIRMVMIRCFFEVVNKHPILQNVRVRVNRYLLREQHRKAELPPKELQKLKKLETIKKTTAPILAQNTIILLKDLVTSSLVNNSEEILQYAIIFLGRAIQKVQSAAGQQFELLRFENFEEGVLSVRTFTNYANEWLRTDNYNNSTVTVNFQFYSTPIQLAQMMSRMLQTYPQFEQLMQKKQITTVVRFQVGYQFYQDRVKRFICERPYIPNHLIMSFQGKYNFGVVSYNRSTKHILVLNDCKFSMAEVDINRVQSWMAGLGKVTQVSQSKLLPLIKLLE